MTNKQSPKKVVKNIEKPKSQRRNCEVVRHFEPSVNYAACRSNLTVEIPLIKVNSDDELTSPKSPKTVHFPVKRQTIVKIPPPNITKYKNSIQDSSSKQTKNEQRFAQRLLFPTHSKLKSSSSSSLDADKNPNRYKAKPKSYYSNTRSIQAQKVVKSAGERGSVFQSKNGSLKSVTDPALIQRELNLKALKQEILENKRSTAFERQRPDTSHFKPTPQIQKLKAEILQSKTSNILQKKLLVTELRSEIAQYQHFNQYHVYNTFGDEPSKKPEKDDSNEPENENLVKCRAGSKKVSIADYVLKNEDGVRSGSAVEEVDLSRNEASSGGPSGTGTDRESVIDTTEGNSNCTVADQPCKTSFNLRDFSDPESLDDDVIRNKILEANQLIDRVKQALNKIKAIKPCRKESAEAVSRESNPSSTDIEETIQNLKRETELLITDDLDKTVVTPSSKANSASSSLVKNPVVNSSDLRDLVRSSDQTGEVSNISIPHKPLKNEEASSRSLFEFGLEHSRKSFSESFDKFGSYSRGEIDLERPKTRRNESDDDLSEQLRKEKFRMRPEDGRLEVSSSFEELEAKLQTISETTESNYSTPRKKSTDPTSNQNCHKSCNTDALITEEKEIQVEPSQRTAEVLCIAESEDKSIQATVKTSLTKCVKVESSLPPEQKLLEVVNLSPKEIFPDTPKCPICKVECLPAWELLAPKENRSCEICKNRLKEENLPGVSIPSKMEKLQNLTIKILPPVIIKQPLVLTQVLNLSIKPNGESANQVENTPNIGFVEVRVFDSAQELFDTILPPKIQKSDDNNGEGEEEEEQGKDEEENDDDEKRWLNYTSDEDKPLEEGSSRNTSDGDGDNLNDAMLQESSEQMDPKQSQSIEQADEIDEESFINEIVSEYDYLAKAKTEITEEQDVHLTMTRELDIFNDNLPLQNKSQRVLHTCYSFNQTKESTKATCNYSDITKIEKKKEEADEELRKMMWYKSYHIFDNPNKHDPGTLDQKSLEKISQIDFEFYRTFINPNPTLSEDHFTPSESRNLVLGLESKTIQCNESSIWREVGLNKSPRKLNFAGLKKEENKEDIASGSSKQDSESQVTLLNLSLDKFKTNKLTSSSIMPKGLMREKSSGSFSSPSEITVTVSYTVSDESSDKSTNTKKSISELHETELRSVQLNEQIEQDEKDEQDERKKSEGEAKLLTVVDKDVINKLYEKLKSVDTRASHPRYTMVKDSQNCETLDNFIKGLTNFDETGKRSRDSESKSDENQKTVNYMLNDVSHFGNLPTEHLELGRNGRYRDEENMFTQFPYYTGCRKQEQSIKKSKTAKHFSIKPQDKEVLKDKFEFIPRHKLKRYSPDTSNSDTVTTSSISEGEILCKHSVSNGEIHICRHRPRCPRMRRNILSRRNFTHLPIHDSPLSFPHSVPKKFDLNDPNVTIEQRRNYFNHWVTYYVKTQDVHESSTSSCSNNNNKQ